MRGGRTELPDERDIFVVFRPEAVKSGSREKLMLAPLAVVYQVLG